MRSAHDVAAYLNSLHLTAVMEYCPHIEQLPEYDQTASDPLVDQLAVGLAFATVDGMIVVNVDAPGGQGGSWQVMTREEFDEAHRRTIQCSARRPFGAGPDNETQRCTAWEGHYPDSPHVPFDVAITPGEDLIQVEIDGQRWLEFEVELRAHAGHEQHGICGTCRLDAHRYPAGWRHAGYCPDEHEVQPAPGSVACSCEWDRATARRGEYPEPSPH